MSEWVDFCAYTAEAVLLWIAMPRWSARFTRPMLTDRNPEWAAANAETIALLEGGGWWLKAMQCWGVFTVLVLLACRLDRLPALLSMQRGRTPSWQVLMTTSNLLMSVGLLLFASGAWFFFRWQKHNVPMAEKRDATLITRTTDDFLPRWIRYLVYGLMLASLLARPVASLLWPERVRNVWGSFFMGAIMSLLLFLVGVGSVVRPPNQMDRMMGPAYRRMEVRICFGLMTWLAALGMASLYLELSGLDPKRYGAVLLSVFVSVTLAGCMLLPNAPRSPIPM